MSWSLCCLRCPEVNPPSWARDASSHIRQYVETQPQYTPKTDAAPLSHPCIRPARSHVLLPVFHRNVHRIAQQPSGTNNIVSCGRPPDRGHPGTSNTLLFLEGPSGRKQPGTCQRAFLMGPPGRKQPGTCMIVFLGEHPAENGLAHARVFVGGGSPRQKTGRHVQRCLLGEGPPAENRLAPARLFAFRHVFF